MIIPRLQRRTLLLMGTAALILWLPAEVEAQASPWDRILGAGYVVNAPNAFIGAHLVGTSAQLGGWGGYLDFKMSHGSPAGGDHFIDGAAEERAMELGHLFFQQEEIWTSVNAAAVRPMTNEIAVYAGLGLSRRSIYREYYDPERETGLLGYYWVEHLDADDQFVNLMGGLFLRAGRRLLFQLGAEAAPAGLTLGATYLLAN